MQGGCVLAHNTIPRIVPGTVPAGIQEHCTKEARPPASWLPFETTKHKISTKVHSQQVRSPAKHEPLRGLPPRPVPSLSVPVLSCWAGGWTHRYRGEGDRLCQMSVWVSKLYYGNGSPLPAPNRKTKVSQCTDDVQIARSRLCLRAEEGRERGEIAQWDRSLQYTAPEGSWGALGVEWSNRPSQKCFRALYPQHNVWSAQSFLSALESFKATDNRTSHLR